MKAEMRAVILSGAMTFEPAPLERLEIRVTPIRRVVDRIEPPLDLHVIPFRYRVNAEGAIAPVKRACSGHLSADRCRADKKRTR